MNSKKLAFASNGKSVRRNGVTVRHTALAVAIAVGFGASGQVFGQATTGSVYGTAPVAVGETVRVVSKQTGLTREVPVDSSGRYSAGGLPVGSYDVSLIQGGNVIASQNNVSVSVNGGSQVPFTSAESDKNIKSLADVTVTANKLPLIDVSSTRETSVITSADLKVLPLERDAESIALLAPGVASGNAGLGTGPAGTPLISFGGNSVVENAYYINGFNTTDPVGNAGGIALPYFAIAEQQTITSGYGAEYGRSTGGVISQVGERGGNDFHAGVYASYAPDWAQSGYDNIYYANPAVTTPGLQKGDLYEDRSNNSSWEQVYDAYISGPLIKDKLFFYITAEAQHDNLDTTSPYSPSGSNFNTHGYTSPKVYAKLDWNINDNNILELTHASTKNEDVSNNAYSYNNNTVGGFTNINNPLYSSKFDVNILKFTSYLTDNLTLSLLAGKMNSTYYSEQDPYPGFDPLLAGVAGGSSAVQLQNPDVPGYGNYNNNATTLSTPGHESTTNNFRLDLDWKLGDHDIKFGIDNQRSVDIDDGSITAGPGYYWEYGEQPNLASPTLLCNGLSQCVGTAVTPTNPQGYYAQNVVYGGAASFAVQQKAQYVTDNWQVTPNLLLNLGLRNDQYTNYNGQDVPYVRETSPQWQPRLGFSWDIFGDSSAKLYGNAGRYYLALPSGLGTRLAGSNSYVDTYYTYTSIDANGIPQGLTQLPATATPFSADGELGTPKDPKVVAATDLKPMYQDEYVLGFQKSFDALGQSIVWTTQATYSRLNDIVDDTGAITLPADAATATNPGVVPVGTAGAEAAAESDVLVNPGRSNTLRYLATDGTYKTYTWDPKTATGNFAADGVTGFPAAFRKYYSLEESLEHAWDGKWMAKIDYVFAKSYGTSEGPTDSAVGQITSASGAAGGHQSGSITEAWDFPELMQYSNGDLPNSHKHTFKAYGTYAITPEWLVSGLYIIQSGAPITCLGYYGPGQTDPIGYGDSYHWCGGSPSAPGQAGNSPWTHQLNLSINYVPAWAGKHLTLQLQAHNVFNEQKATGYIGVFGSTSNPSPTYKLPFSVEQPRYAEFSVKYDW